MLKEDEELRTFTVSEARSLLPKLRKLLARVFARREVLANLRPEIDLARENAEKNGGSVFGPVYLSNLIEFTEAIQRVQLLGVHVKDFRNGLIDFPHERDGRIVYLCWKPDEDEIDWWHEL
ncbi:MAG TPA: DUF2203 domain-containing protein, partial [Blastocatellia bacterium]|nr:DUF2203 domain-containing protein [Blastocatellia bacterium]